MKVLITGGAGYIGSHTLVELLQCGYEAVVVDDLSNSSRRAIEAAAAIAGKSAAFYEFDMKDENRLADVIKRESVGAVIHFAASKAVGESVSRPLEYYRNNLGCLFSLCGAMSSCGVRDIVFSSSATVYGNPRAVPITEEFPLFATNPYGQTKLMCEQVLRDVCHAKGWRVMLLRYFNPVGAHPSGLIGEDPSGTPNNLFPYVSQVAAGRRNELNVFGGDYDTEDGTGVRDYIHVVDLAKGHLAALSHMSEGVHTYNLGTGNGYSVLQIVRRFEEVSGRPVPYKIVGRRPGDIARCYADPSKAQRGLNWRAENDLTQMCLDAWNWQRNNPNGYGN